MQPSWSASKYRDTDNYATMYILASLGSGTYGYLVGAGGGEDSRIRLPDLNSEDSIY